MGYLISGFLGSTGLLEDLFWSPHLDNFSLLQAIDPIAVLDRGQSVRNDDHGLLALRAAVGCFLCQVEEKSRISTKLKLDNMNYDGGNLRNVNFFQQNLLLTLIIDWLHINLVILMLE